MRFVLAFLLSMPIAASARSICGDTLSIQNAGACDFGGGDWNSVFERAKQTMLKVIHNPQARADVSRATLRQENSSSGAAFYVTGNVVNIRMGVVQNATPATYGITLIHELCHIAGHSRRKDGGGDIQSSFQSAGNSCGRVSPYAGCGGTAEMFAESCTAFLLAQDKLGSGCSNASATKNYFQTNLFTGPINSCAGGPGNTANSGDGGMDMGSLAQMLPLAMMAMQPDSEPPGDAMAKFCAENPTSQACAGGDVDCSYPENQAAPTCLCSPHNPAARTSPLCQQQKPGTISGSYGDLPGNGRGQGLLNASSGLDLLGAQNFIGEDVRGADSGVEANQKSGGGGGPNGAGGGAYAGAGGSGEYNPETGPYNTDILQGTQKGGGGSAGGGSRNIASAGDGADEEADVDLKKYLPARHDRNLAGMSLEPADGLTGPFGPSLWEKVSARYQKVRYLMKP